MNNKYFQCAMCKGVFEKAWSDEEAKAERKENFGSDVQPTDALICDVCYREMVAIMTPHEWLSRTRSK
jgi:hypothetical protein